MESLINLLKKLEADDSIEPKDILDSGNSLVDDISREAEYLLITDRGYCNHENIESLKDAGYPVFPIESDNFGWLIGGISTSKGVIAYG